MSDKKSRERRKPDWLKVRLPGHGRFAQVQRLVNDYRLHTVCQSARCPNVGQCWESGTATFMILGDICTRSCRFCAVKSGATEPLDSNEPKHVAEAVKKLALKYVVVTSVTRDDLPDGGAQLFVNVIREVQASVPDCKVEVLIPDLQGNEDALRVVCDAAPDILNHNIETVQRLYAKVRPQAKYERSLQLLARARSMGMRTKSGLMVGLGETQDEVIQTMRDLRDVGCELLTIGQYLQPTPSCIPVAEFIPPQAFHEYRAIGLDLGFRHVESGPLVRSSYHAALQEAAAAK
ncbi:lipoyl synthase [bacterium]|nr:lipoyl synthase [bacterium]